jgi:hypothetical protein
MRIRAMNPAIGFEINEKFVIEEKSFDKLWHRRYYRLSKVIWKGSDLVKR